MPNPISLEMLNIFVVSTPFQLFSATEAKNKYNAQACKLFIVRPDNLTIINQMSELVQILGWEAGQVNWLRAKGSLIFSLATVLRKLKKSKVSRLFIGNPGSWAHEAFFYALGYEELIFLEDGLGSTLLYYEALNSGQLPSKINAKKRAILRFLRCPLQQYSIPSPTNLFTCFPLQSTNQVVVVNHDFSCFRKVFISENYSAEFSENPPFAGFIGQMSGKVELKNRFERHLSYIFPKIPGCKLVYFMHRKQKNAGLESVLSSQGIEIRFNRMPLEVEVAKRKEKYKAFFGFTSTSLFTLKILFPEMEVFRINDPEIASSVGQNAMLDDIFRSVGVRDLYIE